MAYVTPKGFVLVNGEWERTMSTNEWKLVDEQGNEVRPGDMAVTFRGEPMAITGGRPPHHAGSTGRVYTNGAEYYPGVFNLKWVKH